MKITANIRAFAVALLALAAPLAAQDEGIDLLDPAFSVCASAPDAAWYYQVNSGNDERCTIADIRSPLVTAVFGCTSGDCSALTAASGDSLDMGSATSSKPATRSTSLPGTCAEGDQHHDTDSGGTETYVCTATDTWAKLATHQYLHVRDEKTAGTAGGTFTAGSWQTRTLNTIAYNGISGASLSTNQVTLPAGTYIVRGHAPAYNTNRHQARLRNVTDGTTLIVGTSAHIAATSGNTVSHSVLVGRFTLAASKALEIQHQCQTSSTSNGLGVEANFGEVEVYAEIWIERVD